VWGGGRGGSGGLAEVSKVYGVAFCISACQDGMGQQLFNPDGSLREIDRRIKKDERGSEGGRVRGHKGKEESW
jgi:hypothetical protein